MKYQNRIIRFTRLFVADSKQYSSSWFGGIKINRSLNTSPFLNKISVTDKEKITPGMSYFVIGVSGVTCSGKTTITKLLQRSFPWCRIIHQDSYFLDDDNPSHVRVPAVENHVNYEISSSMDIKQLVQDVRTILKEPGQFFDGRVGGGEHKNAQDVPNFNTGLELLKNLKPIEVDVTKYKDIPILIIEGFTLFETRDIFDVCDARVFLTLDYEVCCQRRLTRDYDPPDCPGYFEKIVWPEYLIHFQKFIDKRKGIKVFDGDADVYKIWKESVEIVECRLKEKYFMGDETIENNVIDNSSKIVRTTQK